MARQLSPPRHPRSSTACATTLADPCAWRPRTASVIARWSRAPAAAPTRTTTKIKSGQRAAGADETGGPVGVPQAADLDPVAFVDGVDELAVANVDPDMAQAPSVGVGEDQYVAGLQVI